MSSRRMDPEEVDAAFADIVARLGDDAPPPAGTGRPDAGSGRPPVNPPFRLDAARGLDAPGRTDDDGDPSAGPRPAPTPPVPWRTDPTHSVADALLAGDDGGESGEEGFVPRPTAPLPPSSERTFWLALVGLVLGPALLVWSALARDGWTWWSWLALALLVAGFAALVLRQPARRDGVDDGAQV